MKKRIIHSFFFLLTLLIASHSKAQNRNLDSAYTLLRESGMDTNRVNAYIFLSKIYRFEQKFDSALSNATKALQVAKKVNNLIFIANSYHAHGRIYSTMGDYKKALGYFTKYYNTCKSAKYSEGEADALSYLGNMNLYLSNYKPALGFYIKAAKLNQQSGKKTWEANCYSNMSVVYMRQKTYSLAIQALEKALRIYKELKDNDGISTAYRNLGVCYGETKQNDKALEYYLKAADLRKNMTDASQAGLYNNIGSAYVDKNNYATALNYYTKSYQILQKEQDDYGMVYCMEGFGTIYHNQKNYQKAKSYIEKGITVSEKAGFTYELMDLYGLMADNCEKLNDFKTAFLCRTKQLALRDTVHNENNRNAIAEMQAKFETEVKEKSIQLKEKKILLLEEKKRIDDLALEKQRNYILFGVIAFVLLLVITALIYNRYRTKHKLNAQLERLSLVAKSTENIVIIMGSDGTIEWANESFKRINGISIEELKKLKGNTIYEVSNNPKIRDYVKEAVEGKKSIIYESKNQNVEGQILWEETMLTPVFNSTGELERLIIVDRNITDRKLAEQIIKEKNKDIIDSINYARRIQDAIMPTANQCFNIFPESFILFKPRDIVSGDFYWFAEKNGKKIMAAVDCTGHGVPGALMSMIGNAFLDEIVNKLGVTKPGDILSELRNRVISSLKQSSNQGENKDGMDIALISFDSTNLLLEYAGAHNPLWLFRKKTDAEIEFTELDPDKRPIGYFQGKGLPFNNQQLQCKKGDAIYMFTDGYADQFGGPKGKKFKYSNLQLLIKSIVNEPMEKQQTILEQHFQEWKGNYEQLDDVCIIGIKI